MAGQDVAKVEAAPPGLLDPRTGKLIDLDDAEKLAAALDGLRAFKGEVQDAISAFEGAVIAVAQTQGKKTMHLDNGLTIEVSGGRTIDWDVDLLEQELPEAGLPLERLAELIRTEVSYKVNATVAKQIESSNPAYAAIVEKARRYVPSATRARVKR